MTKQDTKNKYFFGLGTVGRDMLYSLVSMYFISFATEALDLSDSVMWWMSAAFVILDKRRISIQLFLQHFVDIY